MIPQPTLHTTRNALAQILVCTGCCCGRVDRGNPPVPVDWLKSQWKTHKLSKVVHLTISGCLGPCDLVNVVCILSPSGQIWLGGLDQQHHFEAVRDWAVLSAGRGRLADLPPSLASLRFDRFPGSSSPLTHHPAKAEVILTD